MTFDDAIKACDMHIEFLISKLHSIYSTDRERKEIWRQKIALAMYKRQIAAVLQRKDIAA
jgi:hypothetical protein